MSSPVFSFNDLNVLKNLRKDSSILICPPDKGRAVVILNKADYTYKMLQILSDITKFKPLSVDPFKYIVQIEDKLNYFLRKLKSNNILVDSYNDLFVSGTQPGILYGLFKIHKPNFPLRPILSAIQTPT